MLNIKEVVKYISGSGGSKRYFIAEDDEKKLFFSIREWEGEEPKTLEEIAEAYKAARIPSYAKDYDYSYPLTIASLTCFKFGSELTFNNMSLWEYETLIKQNKEVHPALKCAFIQRKSDEELTVICESYDLDSMTTSENIDIVMRHWHKVKHELMELLNKADNYIEVLYAY